MATQTPSLPVLTLSDYQSLAEFRYQIRKFLRFSEQAARRANLEPRQHQLLLALKGLPRGVRPRIGELAERLQVEPHSAVELANRLAARGYIRRHRDTEDRREVLVTLTARGEESLHKLSLHHKAELQSAGPALMSAFAQVLTGSANHGRHRHRHSASAQAKPGSAASWRP
jgi:DNA-binding MarR family transcriptional regulator